MSLKAFDCLIFKDGSLNIRCLHPEDEGTYSCVAENLHGTDVRNVQLNVQVQIFYTLQTY